MTAKEVIDYFYTTYPGKNIVALPEENPSEIICEVDPTTEHADHNMAVAAIKASAPHYHRKAVETYKVMSGTLKLFIDDQRIILEAGDEYVIKPG